MVSLERIFDLDILLEKHKDHNSNVVETIMINLGSPRKIQNVHIGSTYTHNEWEGLKSLLSIYKDIIA